MAEPIRVIVAMSGGVDSSVAAALLLEQGYQVTGMMLKLWAPDCDQADNACCTPEAMAQARDVAGMLGIPFYVLDAKEDFKNLIVDRFVHDSFAGLTPNPCYWCNRLIKWGILLDKAESLGGEFLATGHYARIQKDETGVFYLLKGVDLTKDQSYALSGLNQRQLAHALLPLGGLTKAKVRELAAQMRLPVAEKPDSQDLCFIGAAGYRAFLSQYQTEGGAGGNIVDKHGNVLGRHEGVENYTIGQRKGLGAGNSEPIYVVEKRVAQNELVVGHSQDLLFDMITVAQMNWLSEPLTIGQNFEVKIRYKSALHPAGLVDLNSGVARIKLSAPVRDATPGQILVVYRGEEVIGSGEILSAELETT